MDGNFLFLKLFKLIIVFFAYNCKFDSIKHLVCEKNKMFRIKLHKLFKFN